MRVLCKEKITMEMSSIKEEDENHNTDFTFLSPFFKSPHLHSRFRRPVVPMTFPQISASTKQPVMDLPPLQQGSQEENETMMGFDREHETKKRKHNAVLGRNFFVSSAHQVNRSVVKTVSGRKPRKKIIPLLNSQEDSVDWNQVHSGEEKINNENDNIVILSRILSSRSNSIVKNF